MNKNLSLPVTDKKRVVIIGGGFAGLTLARKLHRKYFQVVLLDRNNYHQFQPLLYQVATAGLEPSAISFPFRKVFQDHDNIHFRLCKVLQVLPEQNKLMTSEGILTYDYLVVASGSATNYFGLSQIEEAAMPMKTVGEALGLRNRLLDMFEKAIASTLPAHLNIVVVGGGPTGVEVSGALAEMKRYTLPKDYPGYDFSGMKIYLAEAAPRLLLGMSASAAEKALSFLEGMGVKVLLNMPVKDYVDGKVVFTNGQTIVSKTLIWASGVTASVPEGFKPVESFGKGGRLKVDEYNRINGYERLYAIGDVCLQIETKYPQGHPQMAQPAMQQAALLAANLRAMEQGRSLRPFRYFDKGSMATIGRNKAVVDLPFVRFHGFAAWLVWMFVHLMSILGVRNRLMILINWCWSYFSYNPSLRLIIKPTGKKRKR